MNLWNPHSFEGPAVKVSVWDFVLTLGRLLPAVSSPWLCQVIQPAYSWSSVSRNSTSLLRVAFYHSLHCFESAPRPNLRNTPLQMEFIPLRGALCFKTSEPQFCSWGVGTMVAHFPFLVFSSILCSVAFYNVRFWLFMAGIYKQLTFAYWFCILLLC